MKITSKQLGGYFKARREWISENDAYNIPTFGITKEQFNKIHHTVTDITGICEFQYPTLAQVNRALNK